MKNIWYGLRVKHVLEISSVRGKKMFLKIFLENTGMALDIVQQSNSHVGTRVTFLLQSPPKSPPKGFGRRLSRRWVGDLGGDLSRRWRGDEF